MMKTLASIMAAIFMVASIKTLVNCSSIVCKWLMRPMKVLALGEGDTSGGATADVVVMLLFFKKRENGVNVR